MENKLDNKKVAVVITNGFEESEFTEPVKALKESGAIIEVISLKAGEVKSWSNKNWSNAYPVDKVISEVDSKKLRCIVIARWCNES